VQQLTMNISGMTCEHCVGAVTRALQQLEGVRILHVAIGSASVAYDPSRTSPDRMTQAIEDAGYEVQEGSAP
jgi:copper ion binding protein